jgi:hypothetical protein
VQRALGEADHPKALQQINWHNEAKKPPKQRRPESRVLPPREIPRRTGRQRASDAFHTLIEWMIDPFPWIGDWVYLFKTRKTRRQEQRLKGGWKSIAGGLMAKNYIAGYHVLVGGEQAFSLVYVGTAEAEVAWSVPMAQLSGLQFAPWDMHNEEGATVRCHFTDASWADVRAVGAGWCTFVEQLPAHTP